MLDLTEIMDQCLTEVFRNVAFMDVALDKRPKNPVTPTDDWVSLRIAVLMPFLGEIILSVPGGMADKLADVMVGQKGKSPHTRFDVVAEVLNIFAGKIFCETSPDFLFEIGIPEPFFVKSNKVDKYKGLYFKTVEGDAFVLYHNINPQQFPG